MRFLFATAGRYPPEEFGGAEASIHELVGVLSRLGHACEVLASFRGRHWRWRHLLWRAATGRRRWAMPDGGNGYATRRAPHDVFGAAFVERLASFRPDLVVCWSSGADDLTRAATDAGVPVLVWVPDVISAWHTRGLPSGPRVIIAGSSAFVAERLGPPATVLRPLIELDAYRVDRRRPEYVTLVNPRRHKGLEVALAAAALLPHRRFLFVEGWPIPGPERAALRARLAAHPNIRLERMVASMRSVYARTAVLIVPSQCEDASPRVILEAQVNGIPVVASRIGGIPDVLADSGELVGPAAPAQDWADAIERAATRPDGARAAIANAQRPEHRPLAIAETFLALARRAL